MIFRGLTSLAVAAVLSASGSVAWARDLTGMTHSCIAPKSGVAVAHVAQPQDCCSGRMQCSQFLSTTTLVRPSHEQHT